MKKIAAISVVLIYFKASLCAAGTYGAKMTSYDDPETTGGEKPKPSTLGNVTEKYTNKTAVSGNVMEQYNQTAGNERRMGPMSKGDASHDIAETTGGKKPKPSTPETTGGKKPKPSTPGGKKPKPSTPGNVTEKCTNKTAVSGNVMEQYNQTAVYDQIKKLTNCSLPRLPENGGLVCVYFDAVIYCKPMCNQGFDFAFLRRSRLYEECGNKTAFAWTTQYIGGSRLAECIASDVQVSGQPSAYFNKACAEIVSSGRKQEYIDTFICELKHNGIYKNHRNELDFLSCGNDTPK